MHEKHAVFHAPANENVKIWRYMDSSKFMRLIDKHALFFIRVDQLDDKFEGSYSKYMFDPAFEENATPEQKKQLENQRTHYIAYNKTLRKMTFVNCWHMNEFESAAMWKLYLKSTDGVAIQSTYRRLADCFNGYDETSVFIGTVSYKDYQKEAVPLSTPENPYINMFYPFLHKRKSFAYEQELRAVITYNPSIIGKTYEDIPSPKVKAEYSTFGLNVPIDLDVLVEQVFVSPTAEKWFEDLVKSAMDKFGLNKKVVKSSLADDPLY